MAAVLLLAAVSPAALAQTPLAPSQIAKFVEPMPQPPVLDGAATTPGSPLVVRMSEFQTKILPSGFYGRLAEPYRDGTYVWGYNESFPGPTIVARRGAPTHVRYINDLCDPHNEDCANPAVPLFLQNKLIVDQTLHWADPLETGHLMTPYLGPVPAVVHLHGGEVPSAFDGGPDAWWTPEHNRLGAGYVTDLYTYPNEQEPNTMFYHDHTLGTTRLNVYAGLAGFYLLTDPAFEPANLPGGPLDPPADQYGNPYQQGMAIQDRMFDTEGQLYFPAVGDNPEHPYWLPEFFGDVICVNGKSWPYLEVEPRRYRFRVLNGSNARFYELRVEDKVTKLAGPVLWQIGSDGGLLDAPAKLSDGRPNTLRLIVAPGERADLIIDFSLFAGRTLTLLNSGKTPFPKGSAANPKSTGLVMEFRAGATMSGGSDPSFDPATTTTLRPTPIERFPVPPVTRALTLNEDMGPNGPLAAFVNNSMWDMMTTENVKVGDTEVWEIINLTGDSHPIHLHLFQFQLLDRQRFSANRYLSVYGMPMAGMGPPLPYDEPTEATGHKLGGNPDVTPYLQGPPMPPDPNETGWKDTFRMNPGEVTRVIVRAAPQDAAAKAAAMMPPVAVEAGVNLYPFEPWTPMGETDAFGYPGGPGYVWHCHIIDHEDNEMMRRLSVLGPEDEGMMQPAARRVATAAAAPATAAPQGVTAGQAVLFAPAPSVTAARSAVRFALPRAGDVDLSVFDVSGRKVATLASGQQAAGEHRVEWNAGAEVGSGLYFVRLRTESYTGTQRLIVVQ